MRHDIEVVIDRLTAGPASRSRLADAVELALRVGEGNLIVATEELEGRGEKGEGRGERGEARRGPTAYRAVRRAAEWIALRRARPVMRWAGVAAGG